ncbi:MAG: dipeptidase [Aestuariivita sp.]|nr:dipeptidase [Aestuariivita sp.]
MIRISPPVFDGHNDTLSHIMRKADGRAGVFANDIIGAVDFPKAQTGGFAGGLFAVWVPSHSTQMEKDEEMLQDVYDIPLPKKVAQKKALNCVMKQLGILFELESQGFLRVARSVHEIRNAIASEKIAAVFHLEGAEAIGPDFAVLDELYATGLRSVGLVWSRPNAFGHGVPFRFPSSPDTGKGLTTLGRNLVHRCNELRIMVDVSHLTEAGFWDVANLSDAPLVASHSNVHNICPHSRNLTDEQLRTIAESGGLIGVNFAVVLLRSDGKLIDEVPISCLLSHLDYLIDTVGDNHVAFGSDYNGAVVPRELKTVANLPSLRQSMVDHGYSNELVEKLCYRNWLRVLEETWGY